MEDSILFSVKKYLGIADEDNGFDLDIIMSINSVFGILTQLGVGPKEGYSISDASATWSDYLQDNKLLEMVKTYMYLKVRMVFDTPTSGSMNSAHEQLIAELEWRINVMVDPGFEGVEDDE
jgi:hypothetical protein